jgi:hypothetical protein
MEAINAFSVTHIFEKTYASMHLPQCPRTRLNEFFFSNKYGCAVLQGLESFSTDLKSPIKHIFKIAVSWFISTLSLVEGPSGQTCQMLDFLLCNSLLA